MQITWYTISKWREVRCQGCAWNCTKNMEPPWLVWRYKKMWDSSLSSLLYPFLHLLWYLVQKWKIQFKKNRLSLLFLQLQALDYEFDNDEFHEYVHGRLPYELLKPDPVLRSLLLSISQRKIVCQILFLTYSFDLFNSICIDHQLHDFGIPPKSDCNLQAFRWELQLWEFLNSHHNLLDENLILMGETLVWQESCKKGEQIAKKKSLFNL